MAYSKSDLKKIKESELRRRKKLREENKEKNSKEKQQKIF